MLLVDEEYLMRSADLEGKFEELGLRPVVVAAKDALPSKEVNPFPFDAVLVNSMKAAGRVRAEYGFGDVPIVLLGPAGPVSLRTCLDLGITSFMTTLHKLTDLVAGIMPALENRATVSFPNGTWRLDVLLAEDNTKSTSRLLCGSSKSISITSPL